MPKIRHVIFKADDVHYKDIGDWSIENAQRNAITVALHDAAPDDLVWISDLDEIPAPDILERINNNKLDMEMLNSLPTPPWMDKSKTVDVLCKPLVPTDVLFDFTPIVMQQNFHYYYFNLVSPQTWCGSVLTKYKNLTSPQDLRNRRTTLPQAIEGGWHFSYMGGTDRIIEKMTSIVDGNQLSMRIKR